MGNKITLLKASCKYPAVHYLFHKIMMKQITNQRKDQEYSLDFFDIKTILEGNKLKLVEKEFFRHKKNVFRVQDAGGAPLILKTGVDDMQVALLRAARSLEHELCFRVPHIITSGDRWIVMEEIQGKFLYEFYESDADWCVKISKEIADDYQRVIAKVMEKQSLGDLLAEGEAWVFSRLNLWSRPIVKIGLVEFSLVQQIAQGFENIIAQKGEEFFGWSHGNIIGDHIIIRDGVPYLLDLEAVPRPGRGYYDFLRSLDFMILTSQNEEELRYKIPELIEKYLGTYPQEEVRIVFAIRSMGLLGWDILNSSDSINGSRYDKIMAAVQFIKKW